MVKYVIILFQLHKNKHVPDMFMFRVWGVLFPMKLRVKIRWGSSKRGHHLPRPLRGAMGETADRESRVYSVCVVTALVFHAFAA